LGLILHDLHPKLENFRDEVLLGLTKSPKSLPCKFFYDSKGSQLFNQICDLEEYYPTRTELAILQSCKQDIRTLVGKNSLIIEYGSGGSQKIRLLLNILDNPLAYLPIDISKDYLFADAQELSRDFPDLEIIALCADYTKSLILPPIDLKFAKKIVFFPGSTIGNLDYDDAKQLLVNTTKILDYDDALLIGVDLKKDPSILNSAYNDKKGITAQFNLNLLTRINESLQANFNLANFAHYAFYNQQKGRIEMHIISLVKQSIFIDDLEFRLEKDELIHTENSYKYHIQEFQLLAEESGFTPTKVWTDTSNLFSVHYLSLKK
jgi:dimethylhistidine N-methyltransferase